MAKALLWFGGLLLAVLSALFTVPRVVDWNSYRGVFEEEASRMLGREVRVGGGVNVRLLPTPYVRFERLRIADTSGTLGEPFFRAENFTMGLSVLPLMRGAIEASSVVVSQPVLTLALDKQGRGNWHDFRVAPGGLPFLPNDISFQSVTIEDGTVAVRAQDQKDLIRLNKIDGEFSAASLEGPFKFRGTADWEGGQRDISISTARPDGDGGTRFKALVASGETGARYTIEATAVELATRPRLSGTLDATFPLRTVAAPGRAGQVRAATKAALDLKSKIYVDTAGASLSEVAVSFDQGNQPQMITGEALASWLSGTRIKVKLASLWLDLDRLARGARGAVDEAGARKSDGSEASLPPADAVRALLPAFVAALPRTASTELEISLDQVNFGGDVASNVGLSIVRGDGPMQLKMLKAGLPGGAALHMSGTLTHTDKGDAFVGDVMVHGTSFSRFLGWSLSQPSTIEQRRDGAFSAQGKIALDGSGIDVSDATSEVFGTPLSGAINYRWEGRPSARVVLEGPRVDLGPIWPERLSRISLADLVLPPAAEQPSSQNALDAFGDIDVRLRVKAGELTDGRTSLRDVDADARLVRGSLDITKLGLTTTEGLRVDLEGNLAGAGKAPRGTLRGVVAAVTPAALNRLLGALGLGASGEARDDKRQLERLLPVRLAGTLNNGVRGSAADLVVDGTVHGGRTRATLRFDGGLMKWRSAPVDFSVVLDDASTGLALSEVLFGKTTRLAAIDAAALGRGEVVIRAKGTPETSLKALAAVRSPGLHLTYDGTIRLPSDGAGEIGGNAQIQAKQAAPILSLIGLANLPGLVNAPVSGALSFTLKGKTIEVRPHTLNLAGIPVEGLVRLSEGEGGRQTVDARLAVDTVSMRGLLDGVLGRDTLARAANLTGQVAGADAAIATATSLLGGRDGVWSDRPFMLSLTDKLEGRIALRAKSLVLDEGLALGDADVVTRVARDRVTIERLAGHAAGGRLTANADIAKAAAGATVSGRIVLDNGRLESLVGRDTATGSAGLHVSFSGQALSPRSLMSVLKGAGELRLVKANLARLSPQALDETAEAVLAGQIEPEADAIRASLLPSLQQGGMAIGSHRVPIRISDGALHMDRFGFVSPGARGSLNLALDLATLKVDGGLRLASRRATPGSEFRAAKGPLPEIAIGLSGGLGSLAAIEPRYGTEALEREIIVRKMERDVEELERLRRLDEERVRLEAERQRQLEAQRAADAAADAAAAQAAAAQPAQQPSASTAPPPFLVPQPRPVTPPPVDPTAPVNAGTPPPPGSQGSPVVTAGPGESPLPADTVVQPPPPRVTRKTNPPPPSPFNPFDPSRIPN